jgi:hypothetical protein
MPREKNLIKIGVADNDLCVTAYRDGQGYEYVCIAQCDGDYVLTCPSEVDNLIAALKEAKAAFDPTR